MKTRQNLTQTICEIGIFSAIGYVLDELQSVLLKGVFVNGGSIGFAMIVVLIIGFRRGFLPALLTGLIMGLLDLATGAYIIHPAQLLFDYLISYAMVSFGVLLKPLLDKTKNKRWLILLLATVIGGTCKLLSHYLSGVLFWASPENFAWGLSYLSPYLYSFLYNIAFIGPSIIITSLLLILLDRKNQKIINVNNFEKEIIPVTTSIKKSELTLSISTSLIGLFLFIWYLIQYIKSFEISKDSTSIEYSFSQDSMVIFVIGLFITLIGVMSLIQTIKKSFNIRRYLLSMSIVTASSFIYSFAKLIKSIIKNKAYTNYIIWLSITVIILIALILLQLYFYKKSKKIISTNL